MPEKILTVFQETDRKVASFLAQIAKTANASDAVLSIHFSHQAAPLVESLAINEVEEHEILQKYFAHEAPLCRSFTLVFPSRKNFNIALTRDEAFDKLALNYPPSAAPDQILPLLTAALDCFQVYKRTEALDKVLGDELAEFYRQREKGLCQLEELSQKLIEQNERFRRDLDTETTSLKKKLRVEFETEKNCLQLEYEAKEKDLAVQRAAFESRIKAIDDSETRHARRQIRQDLKKALAERANDFSLSEGTNKKRWPIHALFSFLVISAAFFFIIALKDAFNLPAGVNPLFPMLRFSFSALALAAAIIFYIRWNDSWFRQHADEEFKLKRLDLDIDRASWVVEMAMEWKDDKGTEIPTELISTLSRNLFIAGKDGDRAKHPGEDLASAFLSASSGIRLAIPGVGEVCYDQKGVKKFGQKVADGKDRQGGD